jgi:phospholipid/cholesterol/gamma-HCH transport system substrate-binding protein
MSKIMKKNTFEIVVGVLVILFSILFVIFTMKITNKKINEEFYRLYAIFDNIEGVNIGTKVKIGGIEIGEVEKLNIDNNYKIKLVLKIKKDMLLPTDSNIKIATSGLIGGKYLRVDVGGEEEYLQDKDSFEFTESTMDLEDMITRFMLNKVSKENENEK